MASGPNVHGSLEKLLGDQQTRITLLERRLAIQGGGGGGGGDAVFAAGTVMSWAGAPSTVPNGWLLCDGRAISRSGYPSLFAAIGTTYGVGDGSTTFNIPNGKGKVVVGQDGAQVEFDVVGETGGAKTHALTVAELPAHTHVQRYYNAQYAAVAASGLGAMTGGAGADTSAGQSTNPTGSGTAHNNLQPYIVQNWIISTGAGSTNPTGAVVPVNLWQMFTLTTGGGLRPLNASSIVWDGPVTGTLGATLSADKKTITLPSQGTYHFTMHVGIGTTNGGAANMNAAVNGVAYSPSFIYGTAGPAGSFNAENEFWYTASGPGATVRFDANAPAGGVYDWSFYRVEKLEPFFPESALTVNQGSTAQRDAIYGVPTTDVQRASLANRVITWFNTDRGWQEVYFAVTGTPGLTARGVSTASPAGWYPIAGALPVCQMIRNTAFSGNTGVFTMIPMNYAFSNPYGMWNSGAPSRITVPVTGSYLITAGGGFSMPSVGASGRVGHQVLINGTSYAGMLTGGAQDDVGSASSLTLDISATNYVEMMLFQESGVTRNTGTSAYSRPNLGVRYVGPPFG